MSYSAAQKISLLCMTTCSERPFTRSKSMMWQPFSVAHLNASASARLAATSPSAVTVYASSARVTRAAKVELAGGDARVLFEGLPDQLVDDSIRVQGSGNAHAKVYGISVERMPHADVSPEVKPIQDRLDKATGEVGA